MMKNIFDDENNQVYSIISAMWYRFVIIYITF